ncbi:MAG TPA: GNAT family N-acetyltransferase [Acidimicrobiia bacterium]|nr:GNAT family N-acetyltransferase [Acidimicrobiia bacterium]
MTEIRPARPEDHEVIRAFTTDTFSWGDYVADVFTEWLRDPDAEVAVATVDDRPVAIARGVLMSPTEGWMHGARVHPDHRRRGLATMLNDHLCAWAASRGALIVRLMIEAWNEAAQRQVAAAGYRMVCEWTNAFRNLGTEPDPHTNGGRRVPGDEQLAVGTPAEIEPAWVTWSTSELARAGRGLYPRGWLMRRMHRRDLDEATASGGLLHGPSGWILAEDEDGDMFVPFVATTDDDAYRLVKATVDRADRRTFAGVRVLVPSVPWMVDALHRGGFELSGEQIWAKTLA